MPTTGQGHPYTGPVQAAVLDWSGTAVDYGCMGPAAVFLKVFESFGITVSVGDARRFMGLSKKEHIRSMTRLPNVVEQWQDAFGRTPGEKEVDELYARTEPMMVDAITGHADPIPGLFEFVEGMRARDIKIGSCTGYTAPMMDVLVPAARKSGYHPDCVVCSSDVPAGRPEPWMCYLNAVKLQVRPFAAMVKIGDTVSDIEEGLNAGMWTIGLTQSGNELGLTEEQVEALPKEELDGRLADIETRYQQAGVHYIAKGIWECLPLIDDINRRLKTGEQPLNFEIPASRVQPL